ncbi:PREDICTED: stonustoxin subunit alpha-like [Poecilia mexicana]|uniref:stonustoxin subunit alpha-like n=1 Tax=Poecilia mexicana TaxID=48701 RepID=UPI00072E782A|nr:PREDICTED: stonustoxin subunit alpha-like [Poecilia mexicana]
MFSELNLSYFAFFPGMTLWDHADLLKHIKERPQNFNNFAISTSESTEAKYSSLDIKGSLKASVLSGTVEIAGSAKYLNDDKTSNRQARVTLSYLASTKIQELSMDHLGEDNMKHPEVFEKELATHVVTAILYGAQAFFVFERDVSEKENVTEVQGDFKVALSKIPKVTGEAAVSGKTTSKEIKTAEGFTCKFYGDIFLKETPVTFQDAIQVYQNLPQLLGANGENAVPMKVWMLPLTVFNPSAAKLVREISVGLVQEAQWLLEDFKQLDVRCNDALKAIATKFPQIGQKLKHFKEMCSNTKLEFQADLTEKLPSIRGGKETEVELAEILKKRFSSPFNNKSLNQWMDCKEKEIYMLNALTSKMKNTKLMTSHNDIYGEMFCKKYVACFMFMSLGNDEEFLSDFCKSKKPTTTETELNGDSQRTYDIEKQQWFSSRAITEKMWTKAKRFHDFAEANKENKEMKFLAASLTDDNHEGPTIYLYEDGFLINENFEPPSVPETVTAADVTHSSVTLKVSPPRFGAESVTSYSVEFCVRGQDGWRQQSEPKSGEITVTHLQPNTEYMFRCRAVTSAGVGPANVINDPIRTSPPSTQE